MKKALHVVISLLVAVPLGTGGLCCCLLGAHDAPEVVAAAPAMESCCSTDAAAEPASPRPADDEEDGCRCPVRETAVFAVATGAGEKAPAASFDMSFLPAEGVFLGSAPERCLPHRNPDPPPKAPLYRALSVLLC